MESSVFQIVEEDTQKIVLIDYVTRKAYFVVVIFIFMVLFMIFSVFNYDFIINSFGYNALLIIIFFLLLVLFIILYIVNTFSATLVYKNSAIYLKHKNLFSKTTLTILPEQNPSLMAAKRSFVKRQLAVVSSSKNRYILYLVYNTDKGEKMVDVRSKTVYWKSPPGLLSLDDVKKFANFINLPITIEN